MERKFVALLYDNFCLLLQEKLAYFRIKELKDVLTQLGLSKQGKKQVRWQKYWSSAAMLGIRGFWILIMSS